MARASLNAAGAAAGRVAGQLSPAQLATMRRDSFLALGWLVAVALLGGASRADAMSQLFVRLVAVVVLGAGGLTMTRQRWKRCRWPVAAIGACAALMTVQLLPLPPALWAALPGRGAYAGALQLVGLDGRWRPASFTPDLTLNSLLALLPALATVLAFAAPEPRTLRWLPAAMLGLIAVSALVSLAQLSSGGFYLYSVTNLGAGVGLFANRNHQALLLAMAFPLLAAWYASPRGDNLTQPVRGVIAISGALAILPLLLVTGSRGGLIEGVVGAALAGLLTVGQERQRRGWRRWAVRLVPLGLGLAIAGLAFTSGRQVAFGRLMATSGDESRVENIPVYGRMIRTFWPFGTGFGSFDPMFRRFEPDAFLEPAYLNHAHNDGLEILIEGGLGAALLLLLFGAWYARAAWRVWRPAPRSPDAVLARAGTVVLLLALIASLGDYPLRVPLIAAIFVLCCLWARDGGSDGPRAVRLAA